MKLFISYSRVDRLISKEIISRLEAVDVHDVWYDGHLTTGMVWSDELESRLQWCEGLVFLISPESLKSVNCQKELQIAIESSKHIFPVIIQGDTDPPTWLKVVQYIDLSEDLNLISGLIAAIAEREASGEAAKNIALSKEFTFKSDIDEEGKQEKTKAVNDQQSWVDRIPGKDLHWVLQLLIGIILTSLAASALNLWNIRCDTLPVNYRLTIKCEAPLYPLQNFVIVSSKLVGSPDVDRRTVQAISLGIEEELKRSELPSGLGTLNVIDSNNSWITEARDIESLRNGVREQASLFNADVVIYGQVTR